MTDPTELCISGAFAAAFLMFAGAAVLHRIWPVAAEEGVSTTIYGPRDLFGAGAIFVIFASLVLGSFAQTAGPEPAVTAGGLIASIALQVILAAGVASLVIKRVSLVEWLGLRWGKWRSVLFIAPAAVLGMLLLMGSLQVLGYDLWIESLGVDAVQDSVKLLQETHDPVILALMTVAAVVAAPICEEIVFRGYFYPVTKKIGGRWIGSICTALFFSAAHGSLVALLPLFIFSGVLVFIYEKTGSIWSCIAAHFCFNGTTVLIQFIFRHLGLPLDASL